jgi:prophage regulatory protein
MQTNQPLRAIRLPEVESRVGLKRSQIYLLEAQGKFPKRLKLSERASAWLEHEINDYLEKRAAARTPTEKQAA